MAATQTKIVYPNNRDSQSSFASWITAFAAQLSALGLVQTSDTGQISTTSPPTTGNSDSYQGYQIWRFADTLQSTYPLFIKIGYGTGNNNNGLGPGLWLNVGSGTNGAGVLTGQYLPGNGIELSTYSGNYYTAYNCYFSGGPNRLTFALWDDPSIGESFFASVERTHDANGNDTSDGAIIMAASNRSGPQQAVIPWSGAIPGSMFGWQAAISRSGSAQGPDGYVGYGVPVPMGFQPYNPPLGCAVYQSSDIGEYGTYSLSLYGASATYVALGRVGYVVPRQEQGYNNNNGPIDYAGGTHILMRYQ